MPRDSAGVYTLPPGNPVVTGTVIASPWANTTLSDIAAQLNNVLTRDGLLGPTSPFKIQDGTLAAPGLAFNSEPGLGWYRVGTSRLRQAAQGAQVIDYDASTTTTTAIALNPRAVGGSSILFYDSPAGSANLHSMAINQSATEGVIVGGIAGTAGKVPFNFRGYSPYRFDNNIGVPTGNSVGFNTAGDFVMVEASGFRQIGWQSGYAFRWEIASGNTQFVAGGAVVATIDGSGSGRFNNGVTVPANRGYNWDGGSFIGVNSFVVRTFNNAGSTIFSNTLDANPGGMQMLLTFAHDPGVIAYGRFTIGPAVYTFTSSQDAQKNGGPTTWSIISDARLKKDIVDYTGGLDQILALQPRRFRRIDDETGAEQIGIIADEAMVALPETVNILPGENMGYSDLKQFNADPVIWSLVNSVKTLNQRLKAIELRS